VRDVESIQFTHAGIRRRIGPASIARLRREYRRRHYLVLPGFLHPALLQLIQDQVERTRFKTIKHRGFGRDRQMKSTPGVASLVFLLNDRSLFRFVERVTGCRRIGSFKGAVRRAVPKPGYSLGWHGDNALKRLVAITINLGSAPYQGGALQIRSRRSKKIVGEVSNTGPGNAVIFPVLSGLEHRNTPVSGAIAKTAFSGWFASEPDFEAFFEDNLRSNAPSPAREAVADSRSSVARFAPDTIFTVPAQIVSRRMGKDTILFNVASGDSFRLDTIGREIWDLLSRGNSLRAVSRAIAAEYGVAVPEVANDVRGLVGQLLAQRLLRRRALKYPKGATRGASPNMNRKKSARSAIH